MQASKRKFPKPTDGELDILNVLWDRGSATVRAVHEQLTQTKQAQYTTTLKQMQVMSEKGLVERDESERSHVYRPAIARGAVQRQATVQLLDRVFCGSARTLLMEILGAKRASKKDLAELRQIIEDYEKGRNA